MFNKEQTTDIILQVSFISIFIGIFFFTVVSKIEEGVVKNSVNDIVDSLLDDVSVIMPQSSDLTHMVNNIKAPNMDDLDNQVKESNASLIKKATIFLTILACVGLGTSLYLSKIGNFSFMDHLKTNLIVIAFIALTEFSFAYGIGGQYKVLDPNSVKLKIVRTLKEYSESS